MKENKAAAISVVIYSGLSLLAALVFIFVTAGGKYTPVERYGGAAWIFILSMIILMPVVIPIIKKKYQK